tara:strand:- start:668 stop:889 length:222 start_codon:yes stop_codon:yes gene_type:complete
MEKDFSIRNIVWFSMILVSAGSVYGMMTQKLEAIEAKQSMLEQTITQDIPDIRERVIRLEILLQQNLNRKVFF